MGAKRDELKTAFKRVVKCDEIARALRSVRWAAGKEMSADTCETLVRLYDRLAGSTEVVSLIKRAQAALGRSSPFEEHSKLLVVLGRCSNMEEVLWVLQSMFLDVTQQKVDNFSKAELNKKHGPINIYLLRKRLVDGLLAAFVEPSHRLSAEYAARSATLAETPAAFAEFRGRFASPEKFHEGLTPGGQAPGGTWLPAWCQVGLARLMRQVMCGVKDKVLVAALLKPPPGGFAAIKYGWLVDLDGLRVEIAELHQVRMSWARELTFIGETTEKDAVASEGTGAEASQNTDLCAEAAADEETKEDVCWVWNAGLLVLVLSQPAQTGRRGHSGPSVQSTE